MTLASAASDAATNAATINAALIALVAGLVGVAVTVLAGFLGAWVQSRREHQKWVRERRYIAYECFATNAFEYEALQTQYRERVAALAAVKTPEEGDAEREKVQKLVDRMREVVAEMPVRYAPTRLVGPPSVQSAVSAYMEAAKHGFNDETLAARRRLVTSMRKALRFDG